MNQEITKSGTEWRKWFNSEKGINIKTQINSQGVAYLIRIKPDAMKC